MILINSFNRVDTKENFMIYFKRFFGLRTVKTAFATALALLVARLLNLNSPIMAGLSAIITMRSSIFDSSKQSVNRMLATILGVIIASVFQYFHIGGFFPTMFGIILLINICNIMNWKDAISLSSMVFIIVISHSPSYPNYMTYWEYGINRILDTTVGLTIGFLVNYIILPPNREEFILKTYQKSLYDIETSLKDLLKVENINLKKLIGGINSLNTELNVIINENKMVSKNSIKTSQLAKINSKFYSAIGIVTLFAEDGIVPIINEKNKESLREYFQEDIVIQTQNCPEDLELAFNYYLEELLSIMFTLRNSISEMEENFIRT